MRQLIGAMVIVCAALPGLAAVRAEEGLPPGFDAQKHMRVSEVRPGMKGYGLSVFSGTKIERFDVEVVSVMRNFNPRHDVVLVRCKGANLEHTGAIAGMSGSPIFLTDEQGRQRLIGAFAYGWPLMKDPVGGVQPIEYMLAMSKYAKAPGATTQPSEPGDSAAKAASNRPAKAEPTAVGSARWSIDECFSVPWKKDARPMSRLRQSTMSLLGDGQTEPRLEPLATPLMVSGFSQEALRPLEKAFAGFGMTPLQTGSVGGELAKSVEAAPLEEGSAIAVPMVTGDADMTAVGTVTTVIGDRVFAFGHSFNNEGDVALPMYSGYIHTVLASLNNSFKLGAATVSRGTLDCDQLVGISGRMGPAPVTIPVEYRCVYTDGSYDRTFHFNVAQHPRMTPTLIASTAAVAMSTSRDLPQYNTLDYDITLEFANKQTLRIENRAVNASPQEMLLALAQPIMAAGENPFERVLLKSVSGTIRVSRGAKEAEILSVSVPRAKYRPGETLKAFVSYRPFRGPESILPLEFELPRDLPDGQYEFAVMDSQQHLTDEQASRPFRFAAQSASEVFAVLRDYMGVRRNAVYMRLMRQPDGVAIGRTAMPKLPSSRRRVLLGAGLSNTTPFVSSTVKSVATDYVMSGQARFTITIDRDAKVETAGKSAKPETPAKSNAAPKADDGKAKAAMAEE